MHLRAAAETVVAAVRAARATHISTTITTSGQLCGQRTAVRRGVNAIFVQHRSRGVVLLRNGHVFRHTILLQKLVALVVATHTHFLDLKCAELGYV